MQGITGMKNKGLKLVLVVDHNQSEGRLMRHLINTESKNLETTARHARLNGTNMVQNFQDERATMWPGSTESNRDKNQGHFWTKPPVKTYVHSCKSFCVVQIWWKQHWSPCGEKTLSALPEHKIKSLDFRPILDQRVEKQPYVGIKALDSSYVQFKIWNCSADPLCYVTSQAC